MYVVPFAHFKAQGCMARSGVVEAAGARFRALDLEASVSVPSPPVNGGEDRRATPQTVLYLALEAPDGLWSTLFGGGAVHALQYVSTGTDGGPILLLNSTIQCNNNPRIVVPVLAGTGNPGRERGRYLFFCFLQCSGLFNFVPCCLSSVFSIP